MTAERPPQVPAVGLPAGTVGISRARRLAGAGLVVVGLPGLTALLVPHRDAESLATPVLLVLLVVVAGSLLGGLWVGLPAALAGGLLLNWFFTLPYETLAVQRPGQLLVLGTYLAVATVVSLTVGVAARRSAEAARARAEAQALMSLAGAALSEQQTLPGVLDRIRQTFALREVTLLERAGDAWEAVATSYDGSPDDPDDVEVTHPVSARLQLRVRGPALFGEDQRVLHAFAEAAATALEGRRLSERAATAAQLEAADRMRTALLAAVSHDLRTPLAGLKAAVSSLRQRDVVWTEQETADLLETVEGGADRLEGLLENLLAASRLQAGALSVHAEPVTVEEIVDRALLALPDRDRVVVELPEDLPEVSADVGLAERVFANLLDNALRHSPAGLLVSVRAAELGPCVQCEVVDHGPGLPRHLWAQVFQPFQSFDDSGRQGIGLGLAVARGFTEAMGGALEPRHTPGGGLTMLVRLPATTGGRP